MFHPEILEIIKKEKLQDSLLYPFYNQYSIAEVVPTILNIFGIQTERSSFPYTMWKEKATECNKVITFVVDGFGYNHFNTYFEKLSFFNILQNRGEVYPITSVFPSTTPAALTTLHIALTPVEHGLPEWTVYFEEFDEIIEPLPFRIQKTEEREGLLKIGGKPEVLFEGKTIYSTLGEQNIKSYYFIYEDYYPTSYSSLTSKGSEVITFSNGEELMKKLVQKIEEETQPSYFFVYWSFIDSSEHIFGPESVEHTHQLAYFSDLLDKNFLKKINHEKVKDTLFLLTADHGQARIRGEDILYLGKYAYLNSNYQKGRKKQSILPTGAPHDVFLFIYPPKLQETITLLKKDLEGKALVLTVEEAIKKGLFGSNRPSEKFLKRIGNLLILPYKDTHIWYEHFPPETFKQLGTHGGLSEEEMVVPFAIARLEDLV